jgi:hypothetical protein
MFQVYSYYPCYSPEINHFSKKTWPKKNAQIELYMREEYLPSGSNEFFLSF